MNDAILKQTVFISLLGHIILFSMFSLSFGPRVPDANFTNVSFWGAILRSADFTNTHNIAAAYKSKRIRFVESSELLTLDKKNRENPLLPNDYLKPPVSLALNQEKLASIQKATATPLMPERKGQTIMFYPKLPYYFALYFKDRQTAHMELMFQVASVDKRNFILVKRKISSGNLEADLLSARYINRYLFIQQKAFVPDKWEVVKIDLSTLND